MATDFPTTPGAFKTTHFDGGFEDGFVTKLNPTGSALVYSTYLGGSGRDFARAIAIDSDGDAFVTGSTFAVVPILEDFPTTPGAFQTVYHGGYMPGWGDAFVAKLNPTGSALVYSTYLGGGTDDEGTAIALDPAGNAYVAGATFSSDFPVTSGVVSTTHRGLTDGFITKLNATGTSLLFSTFLGGSGPDGVTAIALDSVGNIYVAGGTGSADFPVTPGAFLSEMGANGRIFLAKMDPTAVNVVFATFLGGGDLHILRGMVIDSAGDSFLIGETYSKDFPTTPNAISTTHSERFIDAFLTEMNPLGTSILYSTLFGGNGINEGAAVALDSFGDIYITGLTMSTDFPVTPGAFQPKISQPLFAQQDAFVTRLKQSLGPRIRAVSVSGKNLLITGEGFDAGANILMDGQQRKTLHDLQNPDTLLLGKKLAKAIAVGQTVRLQITNGDGALSNQFDYVRSP